MLATRVRLSKVILFGSYAHGHPGSDSDIDVAVVSPDFGVNPIKEGVLLMEIFEEIDPRIEPRAYSEAEYESARPGSFLYEEVIRKGTVLYAGGKPGTDWDE